MKKILLIIPPLLSVVGVAGKSEALWLESCQDSPALNSYGVYCSSHTLAQGLGQQRAATLCLSPGVSYWRFGPWVNEDQWSVAVCTSPQKSNTGNAGVQKR